MCYKLVAHAQCPIRCLRSVGVPLHLSHVTVAVKTILQEHRAQSLNFSLGALVLPDINF